MSEARFSPVVLGARERLSRGRERIRQHHVDGLLGVQISGQLTRLFDEVVLDLYQAALSDWGIEQGKSVTGQVALIAHSGYGRGDMAPYSDIDLMMLHGFRDESHIEPFVRKFTHSIYDVGLQLGFSVRTSQQALALAANDSTVLTSLLETRLLVGDEKLYQRFHEQFRYRARLNSLGKMKAIENSRADEQAKNGETVHLLEPNIKRSRGGLRDIQLIRWIGAICHGEANLETLHQMGALSRADWRRLRDAREFLLRLRNELHFYSEKAQDVVDRAEQMRIAELWGYQRAGGLLAVEQFMRDYFRHTEGVRDCSSQFLAGVRPRPLLQRLFEPLFSHRVDRDFLVGPSSIRARPQELERLCGDIAEILRLMVLASLYDKPIDPATWETIRSSMDEPLEQDAILPPLSHDSQQRFLDLLAQPVRLGLLLRQLHRLRVLEKIIPGMSHARCLLQFNSYHKYTVDEHSLRAVEAVTGFRNDAGPLGEAYRAVRNKRVLHLATLIHDMGKGYEEDHSEIGRRLALETGERLKLPKAETETVALLVHKHLRMSHLAQQHDIQDDRVVVPFAAEVGSPEVLRMLYCLTCADLSAVGPGVLNEWKLELLTDLYKHTLELFSESTPEEAADLRIKQRRALLESLVAGRDTAWWSRQIAALPAGILFPVEPQRIIDELTKLRDLPHDQSITWGRYLPDRKVVEYVLGAYEDVCPGVFYRIAGALTGQGQQILSAEIHTLADSLVLDRFYVEDCDYPAGPPQDRIDDVCRELALSITTQKDKLPTFRHVWKARNEVTTATLNRLPSQVRIDNETFDRATILAVFTYDRMGLLYTISRALFEAGLAVTRAKIGTRLDQVVDVFYVTDRSTGQKIVNETRLEIIREKLIAVLDGPVNA